MVVDDEPPLRSAWERLVRMQPDLELAPSLSRADNLVAMIAEHAPSIVLLDLTMPGKDPIGAMTEATATHPDTRVVVYSGFKDTRTMREAFEAGAWAFVDKLDAPQDILDTIRRVARGERLAPEQFGGAGAASGR